MQQRGECAAHSLCAWRRLDSDAGVCSSECSKLRAETCAVISDCKWDAALNANAGGCVDKATCGSNRTVMWLCPLDIAACRPCSWDRGVCRHKNCVSTEGACDTTADRFWNATAEGSCLQMTFAVDCAGQSASDCQASSIYNWCAWREADAACLPKCANRLSAATCARNAGCKWDAALNAKRRRLRREGVRRAERGYLRHGGWLHLGLHAW